MRHSWKLQDAKNQFSEVVRSALEKGPQTVTRNGRPAVVVVAAEEFARLTAPPTALVEFLRASPLAGADLDLGRSKELARDVDL